MNYWGSLELSLQKHRIGSTEGNPSRHHNSCSSRRQPSDFLGAHLPPLLHKAGILNDIPFHFGFLCFIFLLFIVMESNCHCPQPSLPLKAGQLLSCHRKEQAEKLLGFLNSCVHRLLLPNQIKGMVWLVYVSSSMV